MATFTWIGTWGSSLEEEPQVKRAEFGDGYVQRAVDGINAIPQTWSMRFDGKSEAEALAIRNFLRARAGVEAFDWTPPETGAVSIKILCGKYRMDEAGYDNYSVSAVFKQVFEL